MRDARRQRDEDVTEMPETEDGDRAGAEDAGDGNGDGESGDGEDA